MYQGTAITAERFKTMLTRIAELRGGPESTASATELAALLEGVKQVQARAAQAQAKAAQAKAALNGQFSHFDELLCLG